MSLRNQPRKRIDVAVTGFKLFAENKPENVKYYHHAGLKDVGWQIQKLTISLGIDKRLILTNLEQNTQRISTEALNMIYNATDVGLNTSLGEGWGLCSMEHAATGAAQIISDNSASHELFENCGLLVPTIETLYYETTLTTGELVHPEDVAKALEELYQNRKLRETLGQLGYEKFTSEKYSWEYIANQWHELFNEIL